MICCADEFLFTCTHFLQFPLAGSRAKLKVFFMFQNLLTLSLADQVTVPACLEVFNQPKQLETYH